MGLMSCIIHDFIHPGITNPFIKNYATNHNNYTAVLERFHIVAAQRILKIPSCNFLDRIENPKQLKRINKIVSGYVLATDLSTHFLFIEKGRQLLEREKHSAAYNPDGVRIPGLSIEEETQFLLKMSIKCSDVSNAAKPFRIYDKWCNLIMNEFYIQGDLERQTGLTISNFMNREKDDKSPCQYQFVTRIVEPVIQLFCDYYPETKEIFEKYLNENVRVHSVRNSESNI